MFLRAPRDAWMDSNVFSADFGSGLICTRTETNSEWFMRAPRDAWMDSNVFRADFGSGLICTRTETNSEWFMRAPRDAYPGAQTCCASPTQTPARLANSRRTWSRRRTRKSKCVPSRWKVLSGEFRRRPTDFRTLYGLKWATSVEIRHRLPISAARFCRASVCVPSRWKVLSGEFRRRPTEFAIECRTIGSCRSPRTV